MTHPKVSIILATYNRAHYIKEALDSILAQTYQNWECIIIDDRSTDNTAEIINEYIEKDDRFKYVFKPESKPKGLPTSRNIGLDLATGDFIVFVDDDDIVHPQLLECNITTTLFHANENSDKIDFIIYKVKPFINNREISDFEYYSNVKCYKTKIQKEYDLYIDQVLGNLEMMSCSVFWRKELLKELRFNEKLMASEEWEYYFRVLFNIKHQIKYVELDIYLYYYRKHTESNKSKLSRRENIYYESYLIAYQSVFNELLNSGVLYNNSKLRLACYRHYWNTRNLKHIVKILKSKNILFFLEYYYNKILYYYKYIIKNIH